MNVLISFSSLLNLDLSDFEKQFDNDLNLDKADKKTVNKYVIYCVDKRFYQPSRLINNLIALD
jgi:hypothetical protein